MKTLCLYYSRTSLTKEVMTRIAEGLEADLYEYTDGKDRSGPFGYLLSCIDSFRKYPEVTAKDLETPLEAYDRILVGMPVWAERPCVVGKAFLKQYAPQLKNVYLVVTHMAAVPYTKQILKLNDLLDTPAEGYLSVATGKGIDYTEVDAFIERLRS